MKSCPPSMPFLATVLLTILSACSSGPDATSPVAQASADPPSRSDRRTPPVLKDVSHAGADLADDVDLPARAAPRTQVPWDEVATLGISTGTEHDELRAGALVVRYGKSRAVADGDVSTIYLLEPAGAAIEPIALQWQPASGYELRAIARVDGVLRRYDFDR